MATTPIPTPDHPSHVFVDAAFLAARYGRKRTFVSELVRSPGFPRPVVAGRWRLDHILAWEALAAQPVEEASTVVEVPAVDPALSVDLGVLRSRRSAGGAGPARRTSPQAPASNAA